MTEDDLREHFGRQAVDALIALLRSGQTPEIDPRIFEATLAESGIETESVRLLDAATEAHLVERIRAWRCPQSICHRIIDAEAVANHHCPYCASDFRETGENPVETFVYRSSKAISRSVPWLIAIHGFNTRGPWQEDFSWRIAHRFKYHAPVLIYKYGLVRVGVLFRWRHAMLARGLGARIRKAVADARENQIEEPPDIVIHSFGSQLFRLVLEMPEFSDLKFGRIIAVGSVIRPDFDWSPYLRNGRIEAVLCQCGGQDGAVPFAQFFIPDTGPAGRYGFIDPCVINVRDDKYGHSTAFAARELSRNLARGGRWDRFLREPIASFSDSSRFELTAWSPVFALVRHFTRAFTILLFGAITFGLVRFACRCLA
ncbi:hypothetical protein [Bradyrhizobium embrapense]